MPTPAAGESESDFMARCIPMLVDEGKPQEQAVAVCSSLWENKAMKKETPAPPKPGEPEKDFMDRCVPMLVDNGSTPDAAQAQCAIMWMSNGLSPTTTKDQSTVLKRAYSILEVKSINEDMRQITGMATTPTPDRLGDIVEPDGAQFKLPIPLLWQHDSKQPIGHVIAAKVTPGGIEVKAQIVKSDGVLKERLDTAWESIKLGLVKGLSIGFQSLEHSYLENSGGIRFMKWMWLELSAVTIPANIEANIATIKSIDSRLLAASGQKQPGVVHLAGASAPVKPKPKPMEGIMTLAEQLKQFEAKRQASSERMNAIMQLSADEGRTLSEEETEEYDGLKTEVKAVDNHLVRLREMVDTQVTKATPITPVDTAEAGSKQRGGIATVTVKDNLPPGIEFARYAMCLAKAHGDPLRAYEIARQVYPDQPRIANVLKAAVAGGSTTGTTWAGPLVNPDYQFAGDFVDYLRPRTIIGRFGTGNIPSLRRVPFNVSIPGQTSGGTGYWVGEGAPKPVTKFDFARTTIPYTKVANIAVITEELIRFSNPSAEQLVRDALASCLVAKLDVDFVDPAKTVSAGVSPASITQGATPVAGGGGVNSSTYTAAQLRKDVVTLIKKFIAANMYLSNGVWIMSSAVALNIANMVNSLGQPEFPGMSMQGGTFNGMPVIVSDFVPKVNSGSPTIARDIIVLCDAQEIWMADDGGVSIDISREASLQMLDNPTNNAAGTSSTSPNFQPVPTTSVSMFQTNSVAIRAEREISWLVRRSAAAQYITNAGYSV